MADERVRVLTWNLWWRFGPRWRDRQPAIRATLDRYDPDLVALQEVWSGDGTHQAEELAADSGRHAVFAGPSYPVVPAPGSPGGGHPDFAGIELGIAVLSRWPVLDHRVVRLPARHRDHTPVSLMVRVAHPAGPLPIVATCLEHAIAYTDDRIAQGAQLAELAIDPRLDGPCPVLVAGDLNAAPDSPVLRPLNEMLRDAWVAGGGDPDAVTLPSSHPSAPMEAGPELVDRRIDHVFFRAGREDQQVAVEQVRLAGDAVAGVFGSDHRGVVADLRWRG